MFNGDVVITGGTFNQSVTRTQSSFSFDKLTQSASPRAFHQADSDLSHSTCLANTRVNVLERLKAWALRNSEKERFITWLHGAAGGGKTSIARTIARWCDEEEGILLGEFFFSRADGTANQFTSLVPTLAYRMAVHTCKEAKEAICNAVNQDPHIFLAPVAHQLKKLVLEPFDLIAPSGITPYVIILDGFDETLSPEEQLNILKVLSETVCQHNTTLRILICSRPEPVIFSSFNDPESQLKDISTIISLNDADSDSDIRQFLVEKFRIVKKYIPYPPSEEWPTPADIDYLVAKSSGQFIYAATVEKYFCSPQHRHQAVTRLRHVLDLGLLSHIDNEKHPFADLDALYGLILKTRNDVNTSVKAMAICLEYPKYLDTISPQDLAKVLGLDLGETWSILYELASLLEASKEDIRPFHASFGDFLFDRSRSCDLYLSGGDVATDITCAMLTPRRDPEALPYRTFFGLLSAATPRQDLMDILSRMKPSSIFSRPRGGRSSRGAYRLISLLKLLENHVSPGIFPEIVTFFDQNFASLLPSGRVRGTAFHEDPEDQHAVDASRRTFDKKTDQKAYIEDGSDSDSMPELPSVSNTSDNDSDSGDSEDSYNDEGRRETHRSMGPELASYHVSKIAPLSTGPVWDDINTRLNIRLKGSDSLQGLCDEAYFTRANLPATSAKLLNEITQTDASLFCLREMTGDDISEDVQHAFAKLLPHSLAHAKQSPPLTMAIKNLLTLPSTWNHKIPEVAMKAISEYLKGLPESVSENTKPKTKGTRKTTDTAQRPSGSNPKTGTNPVSDAKPSKSAPTTKVAGQSQKPVPSHSPRSANVPKNQTSSSPRPFLVPSRNQTSSTQKAPTPARPSPKGSTSLIPPPSSSLNVPKSLQSQPTSGTSRPPSRPEPSPGPSSQTFDEAQASSNHLEKQPPDIPSSSTTTKSGDKTSNTRGKKRTRGKR